MLYITGEHIYAEVCICVSFNKTVKIHISIRFFILLL